ncbi:glycolate oxidase subunit GlcE [Pseudomonas fuscovaginae UPB0736]|uniref:glycolate oxidase subunit GlcE n=1 Tax=Pseudomonas asplenii TaxID=53407 RepID=UPI000288E5F5|nr:glycolate oxidase subunit GlcE [Pseudomonas fuscovaginae]UUQ64471.1 glycolate oxidase subunit GlcE [Pseudomonas fuscovaginae UPB0736]
MHERSFDASSRLLDQVKAALASGTCLDIRGGQSKAWLGRAVTGQILDTRSHQGIVNYDPTELIVTARAGTSLQALEAALAEHGQCLPCEPPHYGPGATVGGMVAVGLSGPRRPWAGSVRDFVLGTRVITGEAKHLRFGAEVMKNVAGYDVSRLMAGSFGCLGLITEVSLKVLPKPRAVANLRLDVDLPGAMQHLAEWGLQPLPISAACHDGSALHLRLEGGAGSVHAARDRLGCETVEPGFWEDLKEHRLAFFADPRPLWRLSVPAVAVPLDLPGEQLVDWGGAQRWLKSDAEPELIRRVVSQVGGHATCFSGGDSPFHPLPEGLLRYHRQLKSRLDPQGLFNPGRLYKEL